MCQLCSLPSLVVLEIPTHLVVVEHDGSRATRVAFHVDAIANRFWLPICRPVWDVLDFMGIAQSQVNLSMWETFLTCVVIWHGVFKHTNEAC